MTLMTWLGYRFERLLDAIDWIVTNCWKVVFSAMFGATLMFLVVKFGGWVL